jgi:ribosomal-protein-alanine N-acetyltransferase
MNIPSIVTEHTRLRPFTLDDAEALFQITNQPDIFHYFPSTEPWSHERVQRFLKDQLAEWEGRGYGWWGVEPLDQSELIGWNGLQYLPDTNEIEVGYLLSKDYWGRGWATEGTWASLQFGFETLKVESILAIVHPGNIASQRVAHKCGMKLLDRTNYFGMDCYRYHISTNEFRERKKSGLIIANYDTANKSQR